MGLFRLQPVSFGACAVVTGAGSGLGRAFALELARRGAKVVVSDMNLASATQTVDLIHKRSRQAQATAIGCDVSQFEEVQALAQKSTEWFGRAPTLVINNAGVGVGGRFSETSIEDWRWTLGINFSGVLHGCHCFVPLMKTAGGGAIINVASAAAFTSAPEMSAYNVSKSAVLALSETLSSELRRDNIRINVLCPTLVPTNIIKNGKLPGRYAKLADFMVTKLALTTPEKVVRLTLERTDKYKLYTLPQIDARLLWRIKRLTPAGYVGTFAQAYRLSPRPKS